MDGIMMILGDHFFCDITDGGSFVSVCRIDDDPIPAGVVNLQTVACTFQHFIQLCLPVLTGTAVQKISDVIFYCIYFLEIIFLKIVAEGLDICENRADLFFSKFSGRILIPGL